MDEGHTTGDEKAWPAFHGIIKDGRFLYFSDPRQTPPYCAPSLKKTGTLQRRMVSITWVEFAGPTCSPQEVLPQTLRWIQERTQEEGGQSITVTTVDDALTAVPLMRPIPWEELSGIAPTTFPHVYIDFSWSITKLMACMVRPSYPEIVLKGTPARG